MAASPPLTEMATFEDFLREVHAPGDDGWRPYPWQERFAQAAASPEGTPPSWVVAPTGAGKTIVVDALVWALAAQADIPTSERTASTRIIWAIDRRILVDEVYEHARDLAERLDHALGREHDPLHGMAVRLLGLAAAGGEIDALGPEEREARELRPLVVTRWRGGLPRDRTLVSPFQPQIVTSTVGQIGSRLLFRGYGVGSRSQAVSTGLAATDTTICLDEAHLALPFRETVDAIRERRRRESDRLPIPDLHLVTLTATPPRGYDSGDAIQLGDRDHERLGGRWTGSKTLQLREPDGKAIAELVGATEELLASGCRVVACVANRVLTARRAHRELTASLGDRADVRLLMGPQRPADRDGQLDPDAQAILFEGETSDKPLVVVATQAIEVGIDADFDGMATQSASASALTQRLGRLNRSGKRPGRCVVVRDESSALYEHDEPEAWRWLTGRPGAPGEIDISVKALAEDADRPPDRNPRSAALLTDAIVRQLVQTSPTPAPLAEPDIDQLISGVGSRPTRDVQIVWRCDLRHNDDSVDGDTYRQALVDLVRPQPGERLTLSEPAAKSLLAARMADERVREVEVNDADVDSGRQSSYDSPVSRHVPFVVIRGRDALPGVAQSANGGDEGEAIALSDIRAGDVVVVPTEIGGADVFGLNHHARLTNDVLPDLGDGTGLAPGVSDCPIRLSLETAKERLEWPTDDRSDQDKAKRESILRRWRLIAQRLRRGDDLDGRTLSASRTKKLLEESGALEGLPGVRPCLEHASEDCSWRLRRVDAVSATELDHPASEDGSSPSSHEDRGEDATDEGVGDADASEDPVLQQALDRAAWVLVPVPSKREGRDDSSARVDPPTVESHTIAVRDRVRQYLGRLELPEPERLALELAALAHDLGKVDPRFQDYLARGARATASEPLAKSVFGTGDPSADRLARKRAGLPSHFRHEARSVAILRDALDRGAIPAELIEASSELALFLTGVHHGYGRPLWGRDIGGRPAERFEANHLGVRGSASGTNADGWIEGEWFQLFLDLQERYGPWTLAYLEAIFALADRTVSREGG